MNAPAPRTLRSYQERAATFLYERDAALLVAPLGAGKSTAALTAIAELIGDGHRRHALVIAPKLVAATVWPQEVAAWPHLRRLRVAVLDGGPAQRRELIMSAPARELTVIGVDLLPWLVDALAALPDGHPLFDMLVIDETSRLKDPAGKRARALMRIAGRFRTRWGLTGTPRPNSSMDLFMPMAILTDGALWGRAFVPWRKQRFRPRDPSEREWTPLPGAEDAIAADLATVAMTVADEDMPDLPPLNVVVSRIELPPAVMAAYKTMQRELFAAVEGRAIEAASAMIATGKCAQLANGFLYGEGAEDPVAVHDLKLEWLRELVDSLGGEGTRQRPRRTHQGPRRSPQPPGHRRLAPHQASARSEVAPDRRPDRSDRSTPQNAAQRRLGPVPAVRHLDEHSRHRRGDCKRPRRRDA